MNSPEQLVVVGQIEDLEREQDTAVAQGDYEVANSLEHKLIELRHRRVGQAFLAGLTDVDWHGAYALD